jgi:hypothetical protein
MDRQIMVMAVICETSGRGRLSMSRLASSSENVLQQQQQHYITTWTHNTCYIMVPVSGVSGGDRLSMLRLASRSDNVLQQAQQASHKVSIQPHVVKCYCTGTQNIK